MNFIYSTTVVQDTATPELAKLIRNADPHRLATKTAPGLARHWRDSLKMLPRNKHGYPSAGFWEDAARRVVAIADGPMVRLSCDKLGVRKRLYGGPVKAVNHENVTVPICAEAYGTTLADWGVDNLTLVILADGRKFFALWLGNEENQALYESTVGTASRGFQKRKAAGKIQAHAAERKNLAVRKYGSQAGSHPKVIIFKQASGHTINRAERHANLKFLFRLMPETGDQAPMPEVIPADMQAVIKREVMDAVGSEN